MKIKINKMEKIPLYRQIMNQIIEQISSNELVGNQRLPSERMLAKELNVNRSTIVRAYDELFVEGFVERKPNSGTFILSNNKNNHFYSQVKFELNNETDNEFSNYKMKLNQLINSDDSSVIDGYTGELPYKLIPNISLPALQWQDFLQEKPASLGYLPLRKSIKNLVERMYSYEPTIDELMLTAGGLQSLVLLIQSLLKSGDTVVIEKPSFFNGLKLFELMSINVIEIPVDEKGLNISDLEELLQRKSVQLILTNPNFQNPTGTTMTLARREQLMNCAKKYQIPIIEDDVFGQLSFETPNRLPLLKELAPDNVIYIGSLSKILGNKIQLGWIDAPKIVLKEVIKLRNDFESELSIFPQMLAHQVIQDKSFILQLEKLNKQLFERKTYFEKCLDTNLKGLVDYVFPSGGYYLWLTFKQGNLTEKEWFLFLKYKLAVFPSFLNKGNFQSFRVNFSRLSLKEIDELVSRLEKILNEINVI